MKREQNPRSARAGGSGAGNGDPAGHGDPAGNGGRPAIALRGVVKRYGSVTAIREASLEIEDNEFFTILGPSGCGKTTLLRMIAGFEDVTEGAIFLYGEEIERLPPNRRPINTVFQQYALFPHMTVAENVAFGMQRLKRPAAEIEARTRRMLDMVKLGGFSERKPHQLSGGQQQRVALARAMAPGPKVLLLDEPLSALDLKLRQAMRVELKQLQEETGITFVFVTHDQEEALTMSDRITVMSAGEIQQIGTAHEIYERPRNRFVASFIGETNLLDVTVEHVSDGRCRCRLANGSMLECESAERPRPGAAGCVSIRPERLSIAKPGAAGTADATGAAGGNPLTGVIGRTVYLGTDTHDLVELDDGTEITVRTRNAHRVSLDLGPGDRAALRMDEGAARLLVD